MTPSVSIILDALLPAPTLERALAGVRAQSFPSWELLVASSASARPEFDGWRHDERVRFVTTDDAGAASYAALVTASRGDVIAWCTDDVSWPADHLAGLMSTFADADVDVRLAVNIDAPAPLALAALCVEDVSVGSSLAHRRELLEQAGLPDATLALGTLWDLAVRLLRVGMVRLVARATDTTERELSLDQLAGALSDMLRIHRRTRDLAVELPGVIERQRAMRQLLFGHLTDGLPVLVEALGRETMAVELRALIEATISDGEASDRDTARALLRTADRLLIPDITLHHWRLRLLRAMGHADAVVLACQSSRFPLDTAQLQELAHALRGLGAHDDAAGVERTIVPHPVAPAALPTAVVPANYNDRFPRWLTATVADAAVWHEAARGYASAGLVRAAAVAAGFAAEPLPDVVPAALTPVPVPVLNDTRSRHAHLDALLADTLPAHTWPVLPLLPLNREASEWHTVPSLPLAWMEPAAAQVASGSFGTWLADLVDTPAHDDIVLRFLLGEDTPGIFVDLAPAAGVRMAMTAMADPHRRVHVCADHALHAARLTRSAAAFADRVLVHDSTARLIATLCTETHPWTVHAPLQPTRLPDVLELVHAARAHGRTMQVVWSGTDVPCVWTSEAIAACVQALDNAGFRTSALCVHDEQLVALPVHDAPRAHLLLSMEAHAHVG